MKLGLNLCKHHNDGFYTRSSCGTLVVLRWCEQTNKSGCYVDENRGDEEWKRSRELRKEDEETMCILCVLDALFKYWILE